MKVLMSIKPEYVEKFFSGEKKYELRRKIFRKNVKTIVIYSSSPVMKIVGEMDIDEIFSDTPCSIFEKYNKEICISQDKYYDYFTNSNIAYAIKIKNVYKYQNPIKLEEFNVKRAPQSYIYL